MVITSLSSGPTLSIIVLHIYSKNMAMFEFLKKTMYKFMVKQNYLLYDIKF